MAKVDHCDNQARTSWHLLRGVSCFAVGALLIACASQQAEPVLASEYFGVLETEMVILDQRTRDLTDRFTTEVTQDIEELAARVDPADAGAGTRLVATINRLAVSKLIETLVSHNQQLEVWVDTVQSLIPPVTVTSAHEEFVDAMAGWATTADATAADLRATNDLDELRSALLNSSFAEGQARVRQACQVLSERASDLERSLTCPGDEVVFGGDP